MAVLQREKVTSTRNFVEMQLIKIFIPTRKVLNLILEAFNEVPTFFSAGYSLELAHHLLPFPMASW